MRVLFALVMLLFASTATFSQVFDNQIEADAVGLFSFRKLSNENSVPDSGTTSSSPSVSYGTSIGYSTFLSKRFFLGAAIEYNRLAYRTKVEFGYNARQPNDPVIPKDYRFEDVFHQVGGRVNLGYTFVRKKSYSVYVKTGLVFSTLAKYQVNLIDDINNLPQYLPHKNFEGNRNNNAICLGVGSSFIINNRSAIKIDFEYFRNSKDYTTAPEKVKLFAAAIHFGCIYSLSRN